MRYKTVIFDLDGALVDTQPGIEASFAYMMHKMNRPTLMPEQVRGMIGPPIFAALQERLGFSEALATEALTHFRTFYKEKGAFMCEVYPGVRDLLAELKAQGVYLGVATMKNDSATQAVLEHVGMYDCFDVVCAPTSQNHEVSKAQLVEQALHDAPRPAVMVGDRASDLLAGPIHGIDAVGVLYGFGGREELEAAHPQRIVSTAEQLHTYLSGGEEHRC